MNTKIENPVIPKISIFIDWSNIFVYAKNLGIKIDPLRLCDLVSNNKSVIQRHYFSAEDPNNEGQQRFHEGLKHRGFLVHTHELVERPGKIYCSNCNIEINVNEYRASCDKILFLDDYIEQIKQIVNPRGGL
ncbi:putative uncharacterized protein [groundwater metagenome]